jgi:hypothetical protein
MRLINWNLPAGETELGPISMRGIEPAEIHMILKPGRRIGVWEPSGEPGYRGNPDG